MNAEITQKNFKKKFFEAVKESVVHANILPVRRHQIWYWDFINAIILVLDKYSDRDVDLWHVHSNTPIHILSEDFISTLTYVGDL